MSKFNGVMTNGYEITIQHFPKRKAGVLCLSLAGSNTMVEVARFIGKEEEEMFLKYLYVVTDID